MATYEFIGRVLSVSERSGQGQRGPWKMWEVVVEHSLSDQYTRKALISVWDEAVQNTVSVCRGGGALVKITASIDAREYNGRWFNEIRGFRAEPVYRQQQPPQQMYTPQQIAGAQMAMSPQYGQPIPSGTAQPWGQGTPQGPQGQGDGDAGNQMGGGLPF